MIIEKLPWAQCPSSHVLYQAPKIILIPKYVKGSENYLVAEEFEEDEVDDAAVATVAIVGPLSDPGD